MFGGGRSSAAPPAGYGTIPGTPMMNNPAFDSSDRMDSFVAFFKRLGMRAEADHYRLDVAQWFLVSLFVATNFIRPFAAAESKLACVLHNFFSIFTVPSFVLISGYMSETMTRRRRRYVIAYLVIPYVLLQSVYLGLYVLLYWNSSFRDHPGGKSVDRTNGQFTYNW